MKKFDLAIAGTGGQGVILIAKAIGTADVIEDLKVRVGEIHGVSQRGGSVLCFVTIGPDVYSSTIPTGTADVLLGLEPSEALRAVKYISPKGLAILNTRIVPPSLSKTGSFPHPHVDEILDFLERAVSKVVSVDATQKAIEAGSASAMNMFMVGVLLRSQKIPISESIFQEVIRLESPSHLLQTNLKAYSDGMAFANTIMQK
jgi:indolepyruvate ferredoxin oxidoreductase beta subunit